jgi:hypothetical protein
MEVLLWVRSMTMMRPVYPPVILLNLLQGAVSAEPGAAGTLVAIGGEFRPVAQILGPQEYTGKGGITLAVIEQRAYELAIAATGASVGDVSHDKPSSSSRKCSVHYSLNILV